MADPRDNVPTPEQNQANVQRRLDLERSASGKPIEAPVAEDVQREAEASVASEENSPSVEFKPDEEPTRDDKGQFVKKDEESEDQKPDLSSNE